MAVHGDIDLGDIDHGEDIDIDHMATMVTHMVTTVGDVQVLDSQSVSNVI